MTPRKKTAARAAAATPEPAAAGRLLIRTGIASWSLVGMALLLAIAFRLLREVQEVFPPLVVGFVVVLMLEPLVARLVRKGVRRGFAVAIVYVALLAVILGAGFVAIPAMVNQGQQFGQDLPELVDEGGSLLSAMFHGLNQEDLGVSVRDAVAKYLSENAGSLPDQLSRFAELGLRLANSAVAVILGLILGIYGLLSLPRMGAAFTRAVPAERRAQIAPVTQRLRDVFTGFLRARLIVSGVVGALATVGLWAVGMPFWLILGIAVAVANLVPMIGSWVGGVPVLLVALLTKPPAYVILVLVVLVVAHAVDGYVLSPRLLGQSMRLHPVVVLLAAITGGALLGLWGIFAAVPIAGAVQVLVEEVLRRRRMGEDPAAGAGQPA